MPTFRKWHYVIYHGYLLVYRIERSLKNNND